MRTKQVLAAALIMIMTMGMIACSSEASVRPAGDGPVIIKVPENAPTITDAVAAAEPGDTVEIAPGVYTESVQVATDRLTIRGTDRNRVVLDGKGLKGSGIVVTASGVQVSNLTVRNYNLNGVLVTGMSDETGGLARGSDGYRRLDPRQFPPLQGFAVRYVTASNNGLYGIYVFDAQHGVIENNYASGSADSGLYVGQCRHCDTVVRNNVAELNAVGYEQANASDSVSVVHNRFSNNRIGLTLLSDYQEAFVPQHGALVSGNVIADNAAAATPAHADGGFGIGVGISGGQHNVVQNNLISGHPAAGVEISSSEDIAPIGNRLTGNRFTENRTDLAYTATDRAPGSDNCLSGAVASTIPKKLSESWTCPDGGDEATGARLDRPDPPDGISFRTVAAPQAQPQQPADAAGDRAAAPKVTDADTALPEEDLLSEHTNGTS